MPTGKPPFRADMVGSLLRPAPLREARAAHAAGTLDAAGLAPLRTPPSSRPSPTRSQSASRR